LVYLGCLRAGLKFIIYFTCHSFATFGEYLANSNNSTGEHTRLSTFGLLRSIGNTNPYY